MINLHKLFKKAFFFTVLASFLSVGVQAPVMADMISTEELVTAVDIDQKRNEIRQIMQQDEVRQFMTDNGVSQADADKRLSNMTDAEILSIHAQLDDLDVGQGALGTIAMLLVILILLDVAGVTDIFPGV